MNNNYSDVACTKCGYNLSTVNSLRRSQSCNSRKKVESHHLNKSSLKNSPPQIYTCEIFNVSNRFSYHHLEKRFSKEAVKFGVLAEPIIITSWFENIRRNRCLISYFEEESAIKAASYFNEIDFDGLELKATYTKQLTVNLIGNTSVTLNKLNDLDLHEEHDYPSSHESEAENVSETNSILVDAMKSNIRFIKILQSRLLKKQLSLKLNSLKEDFKLLIFEVFIDRKCKQDLICQIKCDERLDEVANIIKSWRVYKRTLFLNLNDFKSIISFKSELINTCNNIEAFVNFNEKKLQVSIYSFDNDYAFVVYDKVNQFLMNKIDGHEEVYFNNEIEYKFIKFVIENDNLNLLNKLTYKFERGNSFLKIFGKKDELNRLDIESRLKAYSSAEEKISVNRKVIAYVKRKLSFLQMELKKIFIMLINSFAVDEENTWIILITFQLCGFDKDLVEKKFMKIKSFLQNAKTTFIAFEEENLKKINLLEIIGRFSKNNESDETIEIFYDENYIFNFLFISGTEVEEINQVKESLQNILKSDNNSSSQITKIIRFKNSLYVDYVENCSEFFKNLKETYANIKIFNNKKDYLRFTGDTNDVENAHTKITRLFEEFSKAYVTQELEVTSEELRYILNRTSELDGIILKTAENNKCLYETNIRKLWLNGTKNNLIVSIERVKILILEAYVEDKFPFIDCLSDTEISTLELKNDVKLVKSNEKIVIKGLKDQVNKMKTKLLEISIQDFRKIIYPKEWIKTFENFNIFEVDKKSSEFKKVCDEFSKTIQRDEIIKIERVQNKFLWKIYSKQKDVLTFLGNKIVEKWLFYGSKHIEPANICENHLEFSNDCCFSNEASFVVDNFSYKNLDTATNSIFFLCIIEKNFESSSKNDNPLQDNILIEINSTSDPKNILGVYPGYLITFKKKS